MIKAAEQAERTECFYLSYAIEDTAFALELSVAVKSLGFPLWMDRIDCRPHADHFHIIEQKLQQCDVLVMLVSSRYVTASYCLAELALAQDRNIPIVPILLEKVELAVYFPDLRVDPFKGLLNQRYKNFSQYGEALVEYLAQFLSGSFQPVADTERIFLYRMLARLENMKPLTNALAAGLEPERTPSGMAMRPSTRLIDAWSGPPRFVVASESRSANLSGNHEFANVQDILLAYERIQLVGSSGLGKTSVMIQAAIDMAHARLENPKNALLPVYLDLSSWDGQQGIAAYFKQQWSMESPAPDRLSESQTCIFLDIPSHQFGQAELKAIVSWIKADLRSSRILAASNRPLDDVDLVTIRPKLLETEHIRQYLHRYADDLGDELVNSLIGSNGALAKYVRNPFWLATATYVIKRGLLIPDDSINMGQLARMCVSGLYDQNINRAGLRIPWAVLENALSRLGFHLVDQDCGSRITVELAYELGVTEGALRAANSARILVYDHRGLVGFPYRQFRDYFASEGLRLEGLPTRLTLPRMSSDGRLISDKWTPVTLMLVGNTDDPSTTIESISDVNPFLALQCIASGLEVAGSALIQTIHRLVGFVASHGQEWIPAVRQAARLMPDETMRSVLLQEARSTGWEYRETALNLARELEHGEVPGLHEALETLSSQDSGAVVTAVSKLGESAIPELAQLVYADSWEMRRSAAQILGELGDKAATPALADGLSDPDYRVAQASAVALGQIGDQASVRWLVNALRHNDWRVRESATRSLSILGRPAISGLDAALADEDDDVRIHAVQALAQINDKAVLKPLLRASYDHDVEVRGAAINALGKVDDMDAVNRIIESLSDMSVLRSGTDRIRDLAARILGQLGFVDKHEAYETDPENVLEEADAQSETITAVSEEAGGDLFRASAAQGKERLQRITRSNRDSKPLSVDFLKDPDWRVRQAGINGLPTDIDETVIVSILKKALQDEDNQVRVAAVRRLGSLNTENAVGGLLYALRDKDYLVADTAADILQQIGKKAIPGLLKLLKSKNVNMRGAAVESLGKIADPIAVEALIECLDDVARPYLSSERICDLAADALFAINTPAAISAVQNWRKRELQIHAEVNHVDITSQEVAVELEADSRDKILTQVLDALDAEDWESRVDAAKALREYTRGMQGEASDSIREKLHAKLTDEDWSVRWAVTEAVSWIGNEATAQRLFPQLRDPYWMVRIAAVRALMQIKSPSAIGPLSAAIQDESEVVREAIAEALGAIGGEGAIPALKILAAKDKQELVRLAAVDALAKIDHPDVIMPLSRATKDTFAYVRWTATKGLVGRGNERLIPALVARLDDTFAPHLEQKRVCDFAVEALQRMDSLQARLAIENWQQVSSGSS